MRGRTALGPLMLQAPLQTSGQGNRARYAWRKADCGSGKSANWSIGHVRAAVKETDANLVWCVRYNPKERSPHATKMRSACVVSTARCEVLARANLGRESVRRSNPQRAPPSRGRSCRLDRISRRRFRAWRALCRSLQRTAKAEVPAPVLIVELRKIAAQMHAARLVPLQGRRNH